MFLKNSFVFLFLSLFVSGFGGSVSIEKQKYATLSIPKIKLEESIFEQDSKYNRLNRGIYWFPSSYLEEEQGQMILLSHSGNAKISLFKDLDALSIHDKITIFREKVYYYFVVTDIYREKKDGQISIKKPNGLSLALVTCTKNTNDYQTVVIARNVGKLIKND